jgi:5-methylcytosine-specific restriction endonuclease McrA
MNSTSDLKRLPVKFVRDYIKKDYKLKDCCFICGSVKDLELHHLYSVSELFNQWCVKNKVLHIKSDEHIKELRVQFAQDCATDLSHDNLYTLCKHHHVRLHTIYGQSYGNHLASKIKTWIYLQKEKHGN